MRLTWIVAAGTALGCAGHSRAETESGGRAEAPAVAAGATASTGLLGSSWVLEDIGGAGVIDYARATLEFPEAGKVAGRGSCNRFFGSVESAGDSIAFGALGATRMACPEAVMNQESRYLQALERSVRYTIDGPNLLLHTRTAEKALRFTRVTP